MIEPFLKGNRLLARFGLPIRQKGIVEVAKQDLDAAGKKEINGDFVDRFGQISRNVAQFHRFILEEFIARVNAREGAGAKKNGILLTIKVLIYYYMIQKSIEVIECFSNFHIIVAKDGNLFEFLSRAIFFSFQNLHVIPLIGGRDFFFFFLDWRFIDMGNRFGGNHKIVIPVNLIEEDVFREFDVASFDVLVQRREIGVGYFDIEDGSVASCGLVTKRRLLLSYFIYIDKVMRLVLEHFEEDGGLVQAMGQFNIRKPEDADVAAIGQ